MDEPVTIPSLPFRFRWLAEPVSWDVGDGRLRIEAGPRSDRYADPQGGEPHMNGPALVAPAHGVFQLGARVAVEFANTFDAGALLVWMHERAWAKLCLEYSPEREAMVVSVVTRGVSDDCNSFTVTDHEAWLRVSRVAPAAFAFHASRDGTRWELIRHFSLSDGRDPEVGFMTQSPLGEGCTARFSELRYAPQGLEDLRSGR
jgi:regulation of enolase protein 1 (concanavalin A-like superfamily)